MVDDKARSGLHRTALRIYNEAAQYHATSLVAIVVGQFAILTMLQGRIADVSVCLLRGQFSVQGWPVIAFVVIYFLIVFLGCYFVQSFIMFAKFVERLREYEGVRPLESLERRLLRETGQGTSLRGLRSLTLRRGWTSWGFSIGYLIASAVALIAALSLTNEDFGHVVHGPTTPGLDF